ncbi:MAG: hypothetical protein WHT64_08610, partial [Desulfomicrobiaceae bacterium]
LFFWLQNQADKFVHTIVDIHFFARAPVNSQEQLDKIDFFRNHIFMFNATCPFSWLWWWHTQCAGGGR